MRALLPRFRPDFLTGRAGQNAGRKKNLVNASSRSAQSVEGAFAIVKAMRREDLGIIKEREFCSGQISMKTKKMFAIKHLVKIISEQIFTGLLIIFTGI